MACDAIRSPGNIVPTSVASGVAYALEQVALGQWYNSGASAPAGAYDNPGAKMYNFPIWTDTAAGIPSTPVPLKDQRGLPEGQFGPRSRGDRFT